MRDVTFETKDGVVFTVKSSDIINCKSGDYVKRVILDGDVGDVNEIAKIVLGTMGEEIIAMTEGFTDKYWNNSEQIASRCYDIAEAMLAERKNRKL